MGTLFPNSEEHPDHRRVPSPLDVVTLRFGVVHTVVGVTVGGLCPRVEVVEDPPSADHTPVSYRVSPPGAIGSTSANPFFGNIDSTAAQVARQRRMLNVAQSRVTSMSSTSFDWLLDLPSSSGGS